MIITRSTLTQIQTAMLSNAAIFGTAANVSRIMLVKNTFVPNVNLTAADLTPADFVGSTPIEVPFGAQVSVIDNNSGRKGILMKEPVGGYNFVCTTAPTPAQTIYGWALTNIAGTVLYAADLLPVPVPIEAVGNFVSLSPMFGYEHDAAYGNLPNA